jgi:hypothetical protein
MVAVAIAQDTAPANIQSESEFESYSAKKISGSYLAVYCGGTMTALVR